MAPAKAAANGFIRDKGKMHLPRAIRVISAMVWLGAAAVRAQGAADTPVSPFANDPRAVPAGRAVFEGTCVACHGNGGIGGRGPALNTGRLEHGAQDYDLFQTIHDGLRGTGMPSFAALSSEQIWQVVAYVRWLSSAAAGGAAADLPGNGVAARGETLFFGRAACLTCHEVNGRGGDAAADLSAIGARGRGAIRRGMGHPPLPTAFGGVASRWVRGQRADGSAFAGNVRAEDSFTMLLRGADGALLRLDRRTLRSLEDEPKPQALVDGNALTPDEREDIVAYLVAQRARKVNEAVQAVSKEGPSGARLLASADEPHNWSSYWGGYNAQHYSPLTQIDRRNAPRLRTRWTAQLPGDSALQGVPIVVDGIMYVAGSPGSVYAFDAVTGLQLWKFVRKQDIVNPFQINPSNRGVAVMDGRVFVGTLDALLIAIDARTGRELWERRIADTMEGYSITGAPLALPGKLIVGIGCGEFATRGFLDAYDPATGERLWRFQTIPGPGEPGHDTWPGDTWKTGGGGTWLTGSYDPELQQLYWAIGNPAPSFNPQIRAGDNLYTNSVVALDPQTGKLRWHYQFTPNDGHDWDSAEAMVLAEQKIDGRLRKVLLHADRNGMYYVLDRTNGQFIRGVPFVQQNWNDGFDAKGRPIVRPETIPTPQGTITVPGGAATNFQAPSYEAKTNRFFLAFNGTTGRIATGSTKQTRGMLYVGGERLPPGPFPEATRGYKALDASSGQELWRFQTSRGNGSGGVLGTAGSLLFAASADGNFMALDSTNGKLLWRMQTGGSITSSPVSYAVDGRQYIAISAGNTVYSFTLQ